MSGLCSPPTLYLQPALDEIERRDGGVGEAAGQDAAQAAQREVLGRPELARVLQGGNSIGHKKIAQKMCPRNC